MQTTQRYLPRLVGLSLGVILALLIWPATSWLVRSQLALSIPTAASVAPWSAVANETPNAAWDYAQQQYHETALRHPDDYLLQFAAVVVVAPNGKPLTSDVKVMRLRELAQRFPERPALYAAALRFASRSQVKVERNEESLLTGDPPPAKPVAEEPYNTPEQLAAFDADAAEGERLDPNNAYFPFMRSIGLFAAHRDGEALAAIRRAAQKPIWNEYVRDELDGEWKLQEETFGTVGALPRMGYAAGLLFPHYAQLRAVSRVAIAEAVEAEQAGHSEEGLAVRDAVRKCAGLMRVQSTSVIGSLVGIAITQLSMARPGGASLPPAVHTSETGSEANDVAAANRRREQRIRDYDAYLERIGHAERIADADAEAAAGVQARDIVRSSIHHSPFDAVPKLAASWVAGIVLLSVALWMLVLGGGSGLLSRHRLIRTGKGLPSAVRPGAALGLIAGALSAGLGIFQKACPASALFLAGILLCGILALALPGAEGSERLRRMGFFALSLAGAALLCSAFVRQVGAGVGPIVQMMWGNSGDGETPLAPRVYVLAVGIAAAIPLLTLLTLGILSRVCRVPLSVGVIRTLPGSAVLIACVSLLAYGVLVPMTLRQETALEEGMKRTVQHEGRFMAEIAGKQWPGVAR